MLLCGSVAEALLRQKTVCYKNTEMSLEMMSDAACSQHVDSTAQLPPPVAAAAAAADDDDDDDDDATSEAEDQVLVKVTGIPAQMSEELVRMVLENRRYGGGSIKTWQFCQSDNSVVVGYETSAGTGRLKFIKIRTFHFAVKYSASEVFCRIGVSAAFHFLRIF